MLSRLFLTTLAAVPVAYVLFRRFTRPSLTKVRGPDPTSFVFGHTLEVIQSPAGHYDFQWQRLYGDIIRFKGPFGEDRLLVADPKVFQRIFNTSVDLYPREPVVRLLTRMVNGKGIIWAQGEDHKRQKRILAPGFGSAETKAFLNIFRGCADSMCANWTEAINTSSERKAVVNVSLWLSRATLDAIGLAALNVEFGAIKDYSHPLAKSYKNMLDDIFGRLSAQQIFIQEMFKRIPLPILEWLFDHLSDPRIQRAREVTDMAAEISKEIVDEKTKMLRTGEGDRERDLLSLLVKANTDAEAKDKLTDEELFAQISTILLAGHETTTNVLSWTFFELARNVEMQSRVRAEIREMESAIQARGDTQFVPADFDAMPYTMAVVKEGLRYHPSVARVFRVAAQDDVLPLARPVTTESGKVVSEIVIPKGTEIVASIAAYNRNKELWGEDAHEFSPDRWLVGVAGEKKSVPVGVYANLMSFGTGPQACLGWRFAVFQMQVFLVEVIRRFELTMTEKSERVCLGPTSLMTPVLDGELELGSQMPLAVSIAAHEEDA